MHLRILKSFTVPDSSRPFLAGELVTLNDKVAQEWIDDGRAAKFLPVAAAPAPARRSREKAVRA